MSYLTQGRRWANKRRQKSQISEHDISPEEAEKIVRAIVMQTGNRLLEIEYNAWVDKFFVKMVDTEGAVMDYPIPGLTVAKGVLLARQKAGDITRRLVRASERKLQFQRLLK